MNRKSLILAASALLMTFSIAGAQSIFDFPGFIQQEQTRPGNDEKVEFDYDVDFHYYFDNMEFRQSEDQFQYSQVLHMARISPSIGFRFRQDRNFTHRLMLGVDVTKNLGENPAEHIYYAEDESDAKLVNSKLFKDIFYYYNLQSNLGGGILNLYAGIYPRTVMEGTYSRLFFSDDLKVTDPNLEGITLKYRTPLLFAEAGCDWLGYKGIDRRERFMAYTAGEYSVVDWLKAGWAGAYTHVGGSYIQITRVDNVTVNPYFKVDFGKQLGIQELSARIGALASVQLDRVIEDEEAHLPFGAEGVITARHWGAGIENTIFYGDNMMVYKGSAYNNDFYSASYYTRLLYYGEPFYYTHRGYPAGYDRVELFYEPDFFEGMKFRVSAVGHFIFPASEVIGSFLGWQAKASLVFDLDAVRHPQKRNSGQKSKRQEPVIPDGPTIRL